eukprot:GGOE01060077.1.p3 GENE.GGOE01060077.1~~GGOE01060077.1.p3  ORF type:complete len:125 (-),score=1.69 GGOE01060077.1:384-758(-)
MSLLDPASGILYPCRWYKASQHWVLCPSATTAVTPSPEDVFCRLFSPVPLATRRRFAILLGPCSGPALLLIHEMPNSTFIHKARGGRPPHRCLPLSGFASLSLSATPLTFSWLQSYPFPQMPKD